MDDDFGLFNISISDSEGEEDVDISHGLAQGGGNGKKDRKGQSEAQFQAVRRDYRPKIENGEVSPAQPHGTIHSRHRRQRRMRDHRLLLTM